MSDGTNRLERWRDARGVGFTVLASVMSRAIAVGSSFVTAPLLVGYLGQEKYGYWVAIVSAVAMLSFSDFGIGSGLINSVASALARNDQQAVKRSIAAAFYILGIVGFISIAFVLLCYYVVPWAMVLAVSDRRAENEYVSVLLVMSIFSLSCLPFSTVQRVQFASHQGYYAQIWQGSGAVAAFAALLIAIWKGASIVVLALCVAAGPALALLLNWGYFFLCQHRGWFPRFSDLHIKDSKELLSSGFRFLIMQLGAILVFSIDNLILMHFFGASTVAQYSLVARLFQVPNMLAAMWFAALWPSYAHAIAQRDMAWIKRNLLFTTILSTVLTLLAALVLSCFIKQIVFAWTGVSVAPSASLLVAFSAGAVLVVSTSSISVYLNASQLISAQCVMVILYAMVSLPLAFLLPRLIGPEGVAWSIAIGYLVTVVPACCVVVPQLLRRQRIQAV